MEPSPSHRRGLIHLLWPPAGIIAILVVLWLWVHSRTLDSIEQRTLNPQFITDAVLSHLKITVIATVLILVIAIPLGVILSRPSTRWIAPLFLGIANLGQAFPAIALLVLLTMWLDIGLTPAIIAFVAYGVLPVLRNTIVGLQQIDKGLIEAAKGMGFTPARILFRVELPLAVPTMLAGVRTTLVLTVGVATLATFVSAGGLGDIIVAGLKLNRLPVEVTGAVLAVCMALAVDWLARIAEDVLRPKGL
ncbi:ABC transporter permease [Nakamurella sp. UYEF19]|uniref:ABC transporter permease n=1 Tax=Nakamurella sp. UYEF19 TaxID=1756392 RepID=UPI003396361F